jgi:hypothetical protein
MHMPHSDLSVPRLLRSLRPRRACVREAIVFLVLLYVWYFSSWSSLVGEIWYLREEEKLIKGVENRGICEGIYGLFFHSSFRSSPGFVFDPP